MSMFTPKIKTLTHYVKREKSDELIGWFESEKDAIKFCKGKPGLVVCKCTPFTSSK